MIIQCKEISFLEFDIDRSYNKDTLSLGDDIKAIELDVNSKICKVLYFTGHTEKIYCPFNIRAIDDQFILHL